MIDSELTFKKLKLMSTFPIVSFLHVFYSLGFVNLSFVEISYIRSWMRFWRFQAQSIYIKYVSSFSFTIFHVLFSIWFRPHAGGQTVKLETHQEILVKFELENRMTFCLRL